jgi:replicative DNA helicase
MNPEQIFIGSCLLNPQLIDLAVQDGLTDSMFTTTERRELWLALLKLRTEGKHIDVSALYLAMGNSFPLDEISQCEKAAPTSAYGKSSLKATIEAGVLRQVKPAINDIASKIDDGEASYEDIRASVDNVQLLMQPSESQDESLDDILGLSGCFRERATLRRGRHQGADYYWH